MRRLRVLLVGLSLVGASLFATAAPASAARCTDDTDPSVCSTAGAACFVLYKLHVINDPGCLG